MVTKKEKTVKCEKCKKRPAVITFSTEPMMAITHGWGKQEICRQCYIEKIENEIKDCQKNLKEQKKLLKKEEKKNAGRN